MVRELKQAQTTVRMSESMKKEIDSAAELLGISSMEYIRRDNAACLRDGIRGSYACGVSEIQHTS